MSQIAKFAPVAFIAPIATVGLGLLLIAAIGCNQSPGLDAETMAVYRTSFTLAEEPDGVQTVGDVRSTLLGESEEDHEDHDHDGDGIQDHAAADHDEDAHDDDLHQDHDAEDHDEDGEDGEDHDEDGEDHEGHDEGHDHEAHEAHDDHDDHNHEQEHEHHAHATESMNVVMVGHIGGLANPWAKTVHDFPFAKKQAIFYLADPLAIAEHAEHAHEHSHAPGEECTFCAAHAEDQADMLAIVQFVDKNGKVLPVDVRKLFDVKEKDMVVVSGKARVTGDILVIDADGLYVRE